MRLIIPLIIVSLFIGYLYGREQEIIYIEKGCSNPKHEIKIRNKVYRCESLLKIKLKRGMRWKKN